jgi:hypothetical protein
MGSLKKDIKKILKEDFEWMDESTDIPVEEIKEWCYKYMYMISKWSQKIDEELPNLPRIDWGNLSHMRDKERLTSESLVYVSNDLKNIYESMNEIIHNLENPSE